MINLHLGDCMEAMAGMGDKEYDLAIVDPEYGIGENGQRNVSGDRPTVKWKNPNSQHYKTFDDSKIPEKKYFDELLRVSVNQIIWGGNYFTEYLYPSSGWIVWNKKVDIKEHLSMAELAWSSFDIKCNMFDYLWAGFKKQNQIVRIHPTQKPVALYKWLLKNYAKPGDKILDTHGGSMSIAIACYEMGFNLDLWEIDPDYYSAGVRRFEDHCRQGKLFSPGEMYLESGKYV
jgi:site-specific DNA-methyltransferase (adenine-specific)